MVNQFSRTELLLGAAGMAKLAHAHIAVFGVGGVGSFAAEALARTGVGALTIVDGDVVCLSNINRQLMAAHSTVGMKKVDAMRARLIDINPNLRVLARDCFLDAATADDFDFSQYDYVVDAMDTVFAKLLIVERAKAAGAPVVSSMGAGNKLDPTRLEAADIYETSVCPLARVMRRELKARGIPSLKVVYSREPPLRPAPPDGESTADRRQAPGSVAFVPPAAGLILAGEVVRDLLGISR